MAVQKNKRDGVLTIVDNSGTPNSVTVDFMADGLPISYTAQTVEFMPRGKHASPPMVRVTGDANATGSFNVAFTGLGNLQTILQGGVPAGWTPFNGASAEVPLWNMTLTIEGTSHGDASDWKCDLAYTELQGYQFSEGDVDTWAVSYISYAKPVFAAVSA